MGLWSVSITGNDTAQDLISEYRAAFYYNDVEMALKKINAYAREEFDPSDFEWCDYYYSLVDFMWSKGILTEEVKNEAIRLIDSGFGLYIYEEAGEKTLEKRKAVLQKFRDKITSEQPPKKKITVDFDMESIFEEGDIITFQLQTLGKAYTGKCNVSEDVFRQLNGKYVVVRKISDIVYRPSAIEPEVKDITSVFQLYNKIYDAVPELKDVINQKFARTHHGKDGLFYCESNMSYFKKRKYVVLGNYQENIMRYKQQYKHIESTTSNGICFGFNDSFKPDETIIGVISV